MRRTCRFRPSQMVISSTLRSRSALDHLDLTTAGAEAFAALGIGKPDAFLQFGDDVG